MWMYYLLFIFVTLHSVTSGVVTSCSANGPKDPTKELEVSIIVSPVAIDNVPRHLILSWENASPNDGDWIGLFNKEPTNASIGVPLYVIKPQKSAGWELTGSSETEIIDDLGYTKKCLGFWTAYVSAGNTSILASSCLQTEPTWMSDMRTVLSPLKLRQIFLPGTHDSGSYAEYDPSTANNLVIKYTITQEEDILNQLIYGVRYLDIRVGYYGTDETMWWVNHGVMRLHPFQQVLDDVKTFLESTNEIVIMDFHEFPVGFETGLEIHKKLVQLLEQELEEHAVPASLSWEATLGEIWSANKRLIVSYDKADMIGQSSILWSAVSQQWGNVQTLNDLYNYLSQVMKSPPNNKGWSAMAELTPTTMQVITDELGGLRRMAEMVNQNVTAWYRGTWGQTVNIVAADFFRGTGLVESAIEWNRLRSQQLACRNKQR